MNKARGINTGFALMILWCFITSFAHVYIGNKEQAISPIALCLYTFFLANVLFIICNIKNIGYLVAKVRNNLCHVVLLNIVTFFCWLLLFIALKVIEPAIAGAILLGSRYAVTISLSKVFYKEQKLCNADYILSFAMFLVVLYLFFISIIGDSAITTTQSTDKIIYAVILCVISGIALSLSTIFTKRLNINGFRPLDILSVRFIFLIVLTATFLIYNHKDIYLSAGSINVVIIVAFTLVIIPQACIQLSIVRLEPLSVSIISPFMPIITFFLEFYDHRLEPSLWSILGIIFMIAISISGALIRYSSEKNNLFKGVVK